MQNHANCITTITLLVLSFNSFRNRTEFVTYFTHLPHTAFKEFPSDYPEEEGTVGVWGSTFAISPYHTFVECATYTAGATFRPGYGSAVCMHCAFELREFSFKIRFRWS